MVCLGSRPFGDEAGQQILFVGIGGGNQQICLLHTGLPLNFQSGAIALNGHDIQTLAGMLQSRGPFVDDGHIVSGFGQALGKGAAHFAVSYNNNAHLSESSRANCAVLQYTMIQQKTQLKTPHFHEKPGRKTRNRLSKDESRSDDCVCYSPCSHKVQRPAPGTVATTFPTTSSGDTVPASLALLASPFVM